jgi:hypothetical protein
MVFGKLRGETRGQSARRPAQVLQLLGRGQDVARQQLPFNIIGTIDNEL